ncbi:MAG: hypothetical protein ACLSSW_01065 [Acutalibacteraceae bacterium]
MDIYITPEDAKHEIKTNTQCEVQTAIKQEVYTKEDVQKLLEKLQKEEH